MAVEAGRAAIWEVDATTGGHRIFASGLRNPNGMAWEPASGALWTVVNERDELGNELVPDYLTSVRDGGFYGWPYSYFGRHVDTRVAPQRADLVEQAIVPDERGEDRTEVQEQAALLLEAAIVARTEVGEAFAEAAWKLGSSLVEHAPAPSSGDEEDGGVARAAARRLAIEVVGLF